MFTLDKVSQNRLDITLGGHIDKAEMATALDDFIAQSEDITNGRMLYTITDFEVPGLAAIGVEMSRLPKLFSILSHYERCAVLCDTGWVRTAAEVEGALLPGLKIKSFEMAAREDAEAWLAEGAT